MVKWRTTSSFFKLNNPFKYALTDCMWCYIVTSLVLKTDVGKFLLKTNGPNSVSKSRCGQNTHQLLALTQVSKSASDWGTKSTSLPTGSNHLTSPDRKQTNITTVIKQSIETGHGHFIKQLKGKMQKNKQTFDEIVPWHFIKQLKGKMQKKAEAP